MCDFMKIWITFTKLYIDFQWTASPSRREGNQLVLSEQPKQQIATQFATWRMVTISNRQPLRDRRAQKTGQILKNI